MWTRNLGVKAERIGDRLKVFCSKPQEMGQLRERRSSYPRGKRSAGERTVRKPGLGSRNMTAVRMRRAGQ